jgi:hypothetical protein
MRRRREKERGKKRAIKKERKIMKKMMMMTNLGRKLHNGTAAAFLSAAAAAAFHLSNWRNIYSWGTSWESLSWLKSKWQWMGVKNERRRRARERRRREIYGYNREQRSWGVTFNNIAIVVVLGGWRMNFEKNFLFLESSQLDDAEITEEKNLNSKQPLIPVNLLKNMNFFTLPLRHENNLFTAPSWVKKKSKSESSFSPCDRTLKIEHFIKYASPQVHNFKRFVLLSRPAQNEQKKTHEAGERFNK